MNGLTTTAVTVNRVRSPVLHAGAPDASEAMVFVHGNPGPKEDWEDLLRRAGEFGRAVAPDMPGYGAADKPADFGYTSDGYAKHLAGILEQLGINRVHLVMHDFGGAWGSPGRSSIPMRSPAPPSSTPECCSTTNGIAWPGSGGPLGLGRRSWRQPASPRSACC